MFKPQPDVRFCSVPKEGAPGFLHAALVLGEIHDVLVFAFSVWPLRGAGAISLGSEQFRRLRGAMPELRSSYHEGGEIDW